MWRTPSDIPNVDALATTLVPPGRFKSMLPDTLSLTIGIGRVGWELGNNPGTLTELLTLRCRQRPLVVLLDEAHTLDPVVGQTLLNASQSASAQAPFLLVLAGTPGLEPQLNAMSATFWDRAEQMAIGLLELYRDRGALDQDVDDAMALMGEWYNGYRFAKDAEAEVYNTDMVLYYLDRSIPNRRVPDELIDMNVRIDYGKLRHLLMVNRELADGTRARRPNGNFDVLRQVIAHGEADSRIVSGFPLKGLSKRENFLSLLHYFGLLSIRGAPEGVPRLGIPNQTVRRLMYGYLRDAWEDMGVFALDFYEFERLMHEMAYRGAWRPVMARLADAVARQTGIRDYITGEIVVQSFFAAYFGMTDHFVLRSEHELNKGYADLYLAPRTAGFPGIGYGFVLEFKFMKRSDRLDDAVVAEAAAEASAQLRQYLSDDGLTRQGSVQTIGLAVVFHGWEMVSCEAVDGESRGRRT